MDRKKILWLRLDAIGDAILSASMLPHVFEKYGQAQITVVCTDNTAELYETNPFVEKVIGVDKMRLYLDSKYRNDIVLDLRESGFDMAFDTTCSWAQMGDLFLIGSQARETFAFENRAAMPSETLEKRRKVITRLVPFTRAYEPELERYGDFLREVGIDGAELKPEVWTTHEDDEFADRMFAKHNLIPGKTLALFAFGRSHLRTYPYYGEALSNVCRENGLSVVALGDGAAFGFNESCLNDIDSIKVNLSGKTTLRQSASILKKCKIAVGAETGLGHLACAVGVPNVIVIGGGHVGRFMPYASTTSLVTLLLECFDCDWTCKYKRAHCVADVAPEVLEFAVRETFRVSSARPRLFVHPQSRWKPGKDRPSWKMAGKFLKFDSLEVIPVEFEEKSPAFTSSPRVKRSPFESFKPKEKPAAVVAALQKATALRDEGKIDAALAVIDEAIGGNSQFPDLMNLKAELLLQVGDIETAKEILWDIVSAFPFDVQVLNNIVVIEVIQKRYASAIGVLKRLLDIDPQNEIALSNLHFVEDELAERWKVVDAEQAILENDYNSARAVLDEILAANPGNEDAHVDLAVVEAHEGKHDEALRRLQSVLTSNPGNEYALQLMEKILLKA